MDSELKAVSAAYETNGNSAQYFAAKQQNLRNQIAQQREIIQGLERAVEDAGKAYGESSQQVDAYAIRLNNARTKMSRLEKELESTDREVEELGRDAVRAGRQIEDGIGEGAERAESSLKSLISTMQEDIGSIKTSAAVTAVTGVWELATGAYNAVSGFVEGTVDYRRQLSFLQQNAETKGFDFEKIKKQLVEVQALTGDSSAAVEGLSNLLAADVDERQLEEAIEHLAGAVISFPETLKFESLADGLQETIATGAATGSFAELLGRLGVDVEEFNGQLEASQTTAGDLDIALAYLAANGMDDVYKKWLETNEAMVEAQTTQAELEAELAEFGGTLEEYITTPVKELLVEALKWVNDTIESWETGETVKEKIEADYKNAVKKGEITPEEAEKAIKAVDQYYDGLKLLELGKPLEEGAKAVKEAFEELAAIETPTEKMVRESKEGTLESNWIGDFVQWWGDLVTNKKPGETGQSISLVKEAGAEASEAGKEAGKQYGVSFADSYKDFINNEYPRLPNPLKEITPTDKMLDTLGVKEKWRTMLDGLAADAETALQDISITGANGEELMPIGTREDWQELVEGLKTDVETAIPELQAAGQSAGEALSTGFSTGTQGAEGENPFPTQVIIETENAIPALGIAGEEAGSAVTQGFEEGVSEAEGIAGKAGASAGEAFGSAAGSASGNAYSIGAQIGSSFASGIQSQYGSVYSAASSLAAAANSGMSAAGGGSSRGGGSGNITTVLNIDGRAFATATSQYISASLYARG